MQIAVHDDCGQITDRLNNYVEALIEEARPCDIGANWGAMA
jgi:hypothetical protein